MASMALPISRRRELNRNMERICDLLFLAGFVASAHG